MRWALAATATLTLGCFMLGFIGHIGNLRHATHAAFAAAGVCALLWAAVFAVRAILPLLGEDG